MRQLAIVTLALLSLAALLPGAQAQGVAGDPGTLFVGPSTAIGATVPCDSATYTLVSEAPAGGKAYTARSFGGATCTTNLNLDVPAAFVATTPITIRAVVGCDMPAVSAGVDGATTSMRFIVLHGTKNLSGNVNLVGSNVCSGTLTFQAVVDLKGEAFAAGDLLQVQLLHFYTSPGAGDPVKSVHLKTGGADPTVVIVPDLAGAGAGGDAIPVLYQNVTGSELRLGRNETANLNQTEVYNWTAASPPRMAHVANVTGGNVTVRVLANGTELANLTVAQTGNATQDLAQAGNLTVEVVYANFTGTFALTLGPKPAADEASGSKTPTTTSGPGGKDASSGGSGTPDNSTLDTAAEAAEGAPGAPWVGILATLGLAVLVRRRR